MEGSSESRWLDMAALHHLIDVAAGVAEDPGAALAAEVAPGLVPASAPTPVAALAPVPGVPGLVNAPVQTARVPGVTPAPAPSPGASLAASPALHLSEVLLRKAVFLG